MHLADKDLEGENRLVTALFADICGFSVLSRKLSTEVVVEKVNQCFQTVTDTVYRYEGSVNRFIGDCVLAFYGAPLAHENDPERAVLAALDMRDEVSKLELEISVGINTGTVYFGSIGGREHREVSAYGPEINLAKRLQETAKPGEIVVGGGNYRLTRKAFDFERRDELVLKGMEEPVTGYAVLGISERPEKLRGIEGLRARMIGREREFSELTEAADEWLTGEGRMVSVIGEAGIGKSRLVSELKSYLARKSGSQWQEGRCVSIGQPVSYWPFLDILRGHYGLSHLDTEADMARKVTAGVTKLLPKSADEFLPLVGRLLSVRFGSELDRNLDYLAPEQIRHQTLVRLRDWFETMARDRPLLLIIEDLHWADDLSLDLITLLMDSLATTPLMLLCVYRPEREHRCWQLGAQAERKCSDRYTEITLKQLTRRESRELVEALLEIENLPEPVRTMILHRSEGNPFFIEEVIRSLIDRNLAYREGERWKAKTEISEIDVPETIQSVVLARVDRLQAEAKTVLQHASVIGRLFKYRLLEHLSRRERDLARYLDELEEKDLVYEERTVPELEYTFKHAFTQEATYQGILKRRRKEFHIQVARGIEQLYRERLEEYYEELAHHYSRSDDVEKAVEYLLKAGEKAKRSSANDAAITHLQLGLNLLGTLLESAERKQRELALQVALGGALMATKGWGAQEVLHTYARAQELCEQVGESPELYPTLYGLYAFYAVRAEHETKAKVAEKLLRVAQSSQDPAFLLHSWYVLGANLFYRGEFVPAREPLDQSIALEDNVEDRPKTLLLFGEHPGGPGRCYLSFNLWYLGYPAQALQRIDEILKLAEEISHPFSMAWALMAACMVHQFRQDTRAVLERTETLITLSEELGFPFPLTFGTILRGWASTEQGKLDEGSEQIHQGLAACRATGTEMWRPNFLGLLAEARGKRGRVEEGLSLLAEALIAVDKTGERFHEAELYRLKGELLLMQGEREAEAETCFRQAIGIARSQQAKSLELRAVMSLSRLWRKQGKREDERKILAAIYGWFTEGFDTADLKEARALLDELS